MFQKYELCVLLSSDCTINRSTALEYFSNLLSDYISKTFILDSIDSFKNIKLCYAIKKNLNAIFLVFVLHIYEYVIIRHVLSFLNIQSFILRCMLLKCSNDIFDYKNVNVLSKYIGDSGCILSRSYTKLKVKHQDCLAKHIKRARILGLMPFIIK